MLNVERLRALQAVSQHGSVSAAADVLHVTSSAISQQLGKLESEVGQRLLERQGRRLRLTDAARLLVAHTERVLAALERAQADLEQHRMAIGGRVTLGAFPTAVRGLVAAALRALRTQHRQLDVLLTEADPRDTVRLLVRRELDVVVVQDWFNAPLALPKGLTRAPLLDDVSDVALRTDHRLASRGVVNLDELASERWIESPQKTLCRDWLLHTFRSRGHEPIIAHAADEIATKLALVSAGLGVAIVARLGREAVPANVRMVAVRPALERHIYALWRADASRRPAIQAVVAALQAASAGHAARTARRSMVRARRSAARVR